MTAASEHSLETSLAWLRAAGESTRLRILWLLHQSELTVTDLVEILGQSQPRVSRHMKLLAEAGLVTRYQEGAWALFRLSEDGTIRTFLETITASLSKDDATLFADQGRLQAILDARRERAESYFSANADQWNKIRSLHVTESDVEDAMLDLGLQHHPASMLDLGTGTGRVLQLFAPHIRRGIGIDASPEMLAIARSAIAEGPHRHLQVRRGDVYALGLDDKFDLITIHMVLHYLEEPATVLMEAAKLLTPEGRLLIVEFAPHELEFLRDDHAHRRLGIAGNQLAKWLSAAGLGLFEEQLLEPSSASDTALTVTLTLAGLREMKI